MTDSRNPISEAVILAAGLGTRMRPITLTRPKPLVEVQSKTLLDHAFDSTIEGGVTDVVVNVHYLPDQIVDHVSTRNKPHVRISDERDLLLDSGGGVKKALVQMSGSDFFILNADSFWCDREGSSLKTMASQWNPDEMDQLLLICRKDQATGFNGAGDFFMDNEGRLTRRGDAATAPYIYAGAVLSKAHIFNSQPDDVFSLNRLFDLAIGGGRLFGCLLDGIWLHVGTPDAILEAESALQIFQQEQQEKL